MFSSAIEFFARHRTAANILMILMLVVGIASADRLNKQFFPDVDVEIIAVSVNWSGATAEDVDSNIVQPLEPELRTIANVKKRSAIVYGFKTPYLRLLCVRLPPPPAENPCECGQQ